MKNFYTFLCSQKKKKRVVLLLVCLLLSAMFIENIDGQPVTIGKVDYSPQNMVVDSGKGWIPGDSVYLSLTEQVLDPTCPIVENRIVQADSEGSFKSVDKKATGAVTAVGGTTRPCSTEDVIQTGQQTIPWLQVGSFFTTDVDVSVTKTDSQDPVNICGSFYYTITVTNTGPYIANNVVVTDVLDPNATYVSSSVVDNVGTILWTPLLSGQTLSFSTAYLNIGESVKIKVDVNVTNTAPHTGTGGSGSKSGCSPGSDLCNHVSVTTISDDINSANNNYYQPTGVSCETTAPVISGCPTAEVDLGCNPTLPTCETVAALKITATDACFGSIAPVCTTGSVVENGCTRTQKFTLTFTDGCGNSSKCEVNYKWTADSVKPVVTGKTSIALGCNPANPSESFETPKVSDVGGTTILTDGISIKAYPNPFKDIISFEIGMTYDSHVRIEIFANNGTPLGIILDEDLLKGDLRKIEFDGSGYLHTVFMYRITTKLQQLSGTVMKTR
jgi:uncharacterized repeat protein (TIGR01451 family)